MRDGYVQDVAEVPLAGSLETCDRPDLLIHLLAQLPHDVNLRLFATSDVGIPAGVDRLANGYGLRERVSFVTKDRLRGDATLVEATSRGFVTIEPTGARRRLATLGEAIEAIGAGRFSEPIATPAALLRQRRFAVVTNLPTHYRVPLFSRVAALLADHGASLKVFFTSHVPESRSWLSSGDPLRFDHQTLRSVGLPVRRNRPPALPFGLRAALARYQADVILVAGFSPSVIRPAVRVARDLGASVGVWTGEVSSGPTAQSRIRRATRQRLIEGADFALAYGAASLEYMHRLGPELPTIIGRNTTSILPPRARRMAPPMRIVAIGDLADSRKGIDVIVDALGLVRNVECVVDVFGGGARLAALRQRASGDKRVRLHGPASTTEVLERLQEADLFVFPTRFDIFGLSLVEAMGSGLACVVSRCANAAEDLCMHEVNSIVLDGHDPADWAATIERLVGDPTLRAELGRRARATVEARWTLDHSASAMVAGFALGAGVIR